MLAMLAHRTQSLMLVAAHNRGVADESLNMIAASSREGFGANVSEELVTEVSPLIASGLKQDRSGYYSGARLSAKLVEQPDAPRAT